VERVNRAKTNLVERIKSILAQKGLTLHQVSAQTVRMYGRSSPFFLPHNLFYDLSRGDFTPSLHQVFALSRISDFRFHDWLRVFGFAPENITRLQVSLPSRRTKLIDSSLEDPEAWIPWFHDKTQGALPSAITPMGKILARSNAARLRSLSSADVGEFIYAKVGREDAFAFPDLVPGSIVRSITRLPREAVASGDNPDRLFLIEHAAGFCCCRLQAAGKNRIVPLSMQLPYAQPELNLHDEVRILGMIDLEIRSMISREPPVVPKELAKQWKPAILHSGGKLGRLLRGARLRMGLSFRDASAMSRRIVLELDDPRYSVAAGSLSDYEVLDTSPRHIHKAISLCAMYGLNFSVFLQSAGLKADEAGNDPIPDHLLPRSIPVDIRTDKQASDSSGKALDELFRESEALPFFLRTSLPLLSGLKSLSLRDFFWIGGIKEPLHRLLEAGLVLIVNRRRKKPLYLRSVPFWQQPLYVLLLRDGRYICSSCSLENNTLVLHPYISHYREPLQLRNHYDAEVVGEVATLVRRL
jgi:hypothetical protein